MSHPMTPKPSRQELEAWANCAVPDCEFKVTHESDKCYPHTFGWDAVRLNEEEERRRIVRKSSKPIRRPA